MPFEDGKVIPPFLRLARAVRGKLPADPTKVATGILAEIPDVLGLIGKAVVPIGFPIPVRSGLGDVAQAGFAIAPPCFRALMGLRAPLQRLSRIAHCANYVVNLGDPGASFGWHGA